MFPCARIRPQCRNLHPFFATPKRFRHATNLYPTYLAMDVDKTGKAGDIVLLRAGYARNYVAGTGKGIMIPRDQRAFAKHRHVYESLGYPVAKIDQYYTGELAAISKGEQRKPTSGLTSYVSSGKSSSIADLITARLKVNEALDSTLSSNPIVIETPSDPNTGFSTGVTPKEIMEVFVSRNVPDLESVVSSLDQIAFYVPSEAPGRRLQKSRVLTNPGKYLATVYIPLVGYLRYWITVKSARASRDLESS